MVLFRHLVRELSGPNFSIPMDNLLRFEWTVGVDIFFVTSGFLMYFLTNRHFAEKDYPFEFLRRRFVRIVPLYWLFTTLMLAITILIPGEVRQFDWSVGHIVSSYLFIPWQRAQGQVFPILGLGWTLNYEMLFYFAFTIALFFPRRTAIVGLVSAFLIAVAVGEFIPDSQVMVKFWTAPIILEFIGGVLLSMAFVGGLRLHLSTRIFLAALGVIASLVCVHFNLTDQRWRIVWGGIPAILLASSAILGPPPRQSGGQSGPLVRMMVFLGGASYALYLSHMFAIRPLTAVWKKLHLAGGLAYLGVGFIAALVLASAVYVYVEKPTLAALKRIIRPKVGVVA